MKKILQKIDNLVYIYNQNYKVSLYTYRDKKREMSMIKMNDLVKLTNTPKSTILYYIKEGILPQPYKDKPNFHLYDESNITLLEFIKYLQSHFNASITQIKYLFAQPDFDKKIPYESLIHFLPFIVTSDNTCFRLEELCDELKLSEQMIKKYQEKGLLNPNSSSYTEKDREVLSILSQCNETELNLIQTYIDVAKKLAQFEINMTLDGLTNSNQKDEKLKHLFNILLILKPYIFNMETFKHYQKISTL